MKNKKGKIYIGTSGWVYQHWIGKFYPENLPQDKWLDFYTKNFQTVELNASFYHLPQAKTFANWREKTPKNFLFSVKASRFITHIKKLKGSREPWQRFIKASQELKEKLGPILFQLPPSFKTDSKKLESFLKMTTKLSSWRLAFEFRHPSWFCEKIYQIMKKYQVALCLADSPRYPTTEAVTSSFVYLRFHGGQVLYGSNYSLSELKKWAAKIKNWQNQGLDIYAYFNNDAYGYAVDNALRLTQLVKI